MAKDYSRSEGPLEYKSRAKTGIFNKSSFSGIQKTNVNVQNSNIFLSEVDNLLEKGAIKLVPQENLRTGFYSAFLPVPKKSEVLRPVINLKPLNRYLRKTHFKMDCLSKVLNLVQKGDWAISIDLGDTYFIFPLM